MKRPRNRLRADLANGFADNGSRRPDATGQAALRHLRAGLSGNCGLFWTAGDLLPVIRGQTSDHSECSDLYRHLLDWHRTDLFNWVGITKSKLAAVPP